MPPAGPMLWFEYQWQHFVMPNNIVTRTIHAHTHTFRTHLMGFDVYSDYSTTPLYMCGSFNPLARCRLLCLIKWGSICRRWHEIKRKKESRTKFIHSFAHTRASSTHIKVKAKRNWETAEYIGGKRHFRCPQNTRCSCHTENIAREKKVFFFSALLLLAPSSLSLSPFIAHRSYWAFYRQHNWINESFSILWVCFQKLRIEIVYTFSWCECPVQCARRYPCIAIRFDLYMANFICMPQSRCARTFPRSHRVQHEWHTHTRNTLHYTLMARRIAILRGYLCSDGIRSNIPPIVSTWHTWLGFNANLYTYIFRTTPDYTIYVSSFTWHSSIVRVWTKHPHRIPHEIRWYF